MGSLRTILAERSLSLGLDYEPASVDLLEIHKEQVNIGVETRGYYGIAYTNNPEMVPVVCRYGLLRNWRVKVEADTNPTRIAIILMKE